MRGVWAYELRAETTNGRIEGVLWADGELAIGPPEVERKGVLGPDALAGALEATGVPGAEARLLAQVLWEGRPAGFRKEQERDT
jgi:hypothetical protein